MSKNDDESADSYDDLSDSEEDEDSNAGLANRIPASHEVAMTHGPRSILALASDPSGARLASGSIDSRFFSSPIYFDQFFSVETMIKPKNRITNKKGTISLNA